MKQFFLFMFIFLGVPVLLYADNASENRSGDLILEKDTGKKAESASPTKEDPGGKKTYKVLPNLRDCKPTARFKVNIFEEIPGEETLVDVCEKEDKTVIKVYTFPNRKTYAFAVEKDGKDIIYVDTKNSGIFDWETTGKVFVNKKAYGY